MPAPLKRCPLRGRHHRARNDPRHGALHGAGAAGRKRSRRAQRHLGPWRLDLRDGNGHAPFDGDSPASIIGAILKDTPQPISSRQPLSPPALDHIASRCLDKDPDERWQTAADLMRELRWAAADHARPASEPQSSSRWSLLRLGWVAAAIGLAGLIAAAALFRPSREVTRPATVMKFAVAPPSNAIFASQPATVPSTQLALSPDGRWLAFVAESAGSEAMLWIRPIDGTTAQPLSGTEEASYPFWAPDSRAIAFSRRAS